MTFALSSQQRTVLLMACGLLGIVAVFYFESVEPLRRQTRFARNVRADLESLAGKRPPDLTEKQWKGVVDWTLNAQANCLRFQKGIKRSDMDAFEAELGRRVRGPVSLQTVDWIWDEVARISAQGARYAEAWRPTTPERLREFEAAGDGKSRAESAPAAATSGG